MIGEALAKRSDSLRAKRVIYIDDILELGTEVERGDGALAADLPARQSRNETG